MLIFRSPVQKYVILFKLCYFCSKYPYFYSTSLIRLCTIFSTTVSYFHQELVQLLNSFWNVSAQFISITLESFWKQYGFWNFSLLMHFLSAPASTDLTGTFATSRFIWPGMPKICIFIFFPIFILLSTPWITDLNTLTFFIVSNCAWNFLHALDNVMTVVVPYSRQ